MHGTIPTELIRLIHPITGRFIAEYDPLRGLLLVVDRGKQAIIDLVRMEKAQPEAQNDDKRTNQGHAGGNR